MRDSWVPFLLAGFILAGAGASAWAGPQHWGFGFSYLAAIEDVGGSRRLIVYEPPLHASDTTWPSRWLDRTTVLADVPSGGIAVGDFWPAAFSREYLAAVIPAAGSLTVRVYDPPQCFGTAPWALVSTSGAVALTGTFLGAAAGNLRNLGKDQLLVASDDGAGIRVAILVPPSTAFGTTWTKAAEAALPAVPGTYLGIACGDFWNENKDHLALAASDGGATRLYFFSYDSGTNAFTLVATDAAADLPPLVFNGLTAADYQKDGFDVLTLVGTGGFQLRVAPARAGQAYDYGPEYTGKALSGQWMPGNGGAASLVVMTGAFGAAADARAAVAAGRLFGYINTDLNSRYAVSTGPDAQIAFARRSPTKDQCGTYGWPTYGQTVTYGIHLNNNGGTAIPAGQVRLKVWVNRPNRNADTDPATCDAPDVDQLIDAELPAYNSASPGYVARSVTLAWPYTLIPAGPGASWQKLNVEAVGERWVIAVLEYAGDVNLRNNRYEMALHGLTFHPILRTPSSLADRQPTVSGDPPGKEYLCRKLADAVQCMWERSQTRDGQDVLQRLWFDSYEIGWPDDQPNPAEAWAAVQAKYEGWRELDGWWGVNQGWERFNWTDGGGELHETGHLFHPVGDLYQYYVSPVFTGGATMADGTPVQLRTWVWPPDSYGSGHTRISWPACEMMKRCLVGVRNGSIDQWWTLVPDRTFVRVLDRDGNPVAGAEVKLWIERKRTASATGTTGADGRWETTSLWGPLTTDAFGRKHCWSAGYLLDTQIYTVRIGDNYQDCAVLGAEGTAAHSRHTRMGHSFTDTAAWTWDLHTNYRPGAPPPTFQLTAAVQGSNAKLGITGTPGATYRVYRRWEPAYVRTWVGDYPASAATLTISLSLAAADSYGSGRFRATYEVTEVGGGSESLPRTVQLTGVSNAYGLTATTDGRLLVAANAGIANPFCQVFDGTTPYQELFYHFRFGHTAVKVVPSRKTAGRYYATLSFSDMTPDYRFDVIPAPTGSDYGYDVRNDIAGMHARAFTTSSPFSIRCYSAQDAARYQPGDQVNGTVASPRVLSVSGDTIYTETAAFASGDVNPWFTGQRLAGRPGSNAALRELQSARGLDTLLVNGNEYIAIADTGNRRVVVWTDATAYVTHWQSSDTAARPAAIATHPTHPGKFFLLDRRTSGTSRLYLFTFDGSALSIDIGYPVAVAVGDWSDVSEMGLAAAIDPESGGVTLLMTDARVNRVYRFAESGGAWPIVETCAQPIGVFAGGTSLARPSDVAFVPLANGLKWYAVDGRNRVVQLGRLVVPVAESASVETAVNTPIDITLVGASPDGNPLDYIIATLPAQGTLSDPGAGPIAAVPHTLAGRGRVVRYTPAWGFTGSDSFQFRVNDGRNSAPATISITVGGPQRIASFPMDTNPGWSTQGQWAFGVPTGRGGQHGFPDPTAGHTGANVYGYNLDGDYPPNLPETHLTSTAIDCRGRSQIRLKFWRWLGVEKHAYDKAYVRVSRDGTTWTTVWQNPAGADTTDSAWTQQEIDISAVADDQPTVYLRWTMGPTDGSWQFCGWNIDDVELWGVLTPASAPGDLDGDGDVDLADFGAFQVCFNGPNRPAAAAGCGPADFDTDNDVDLADFAVFQGCFNGPNRPPACP